MLFLHPENTTSANKCLDWFKNTGIRRDHGCILQCLNTAKNSNPECSRRCAEFCGAGKYGQSKLKASGYDEGLNMADLAFATTNPTPISLIANSLSKHAKNLCSQIFTHKGRDDSNDACRHFVWAALLYGALGPKDSKKILNNHENIPQVNEEAKNMDLFNNNLGLRAAKKILGKLNIKRARGLRLYHQAVLEDFKKRCQNKEFMVIKGEKECDLNETSQEE